MMKRQGDILIVKVKSIPTQATPHKSRILAEGEMTNHLHKLDDQSEVFEERGVLYFRVKENSKSVLSHPEHGPLTFEPGSYRVIRQREYTPGNWRFVND